MNYVIYLGLFVHLEHVNSFQQFNVDNFLFTFLILHAYKFYNKIKVSN